MQDCFRAHPETYGSELEDDEDEVEQELLARETAQPAKETPVEESASKAASAPSTESKSETQKPEYKEETEHHRDSQHTAPGTAQAKGDEGGELLPKSIHDATQ